MAMTHLISIRTAIYARVCQMALDAGALIMRHYHDGVTEEKADKPVTQADRDAEILLEKALAKWPRIFK